MASKSNEDLREKLKVMIDASLLLADSDKVVLLKRIGSFSDAKVSRLLDLLQNEQKVATSFYQKAKENHIQYQRVFERAKSAVRGRLESDENNAADDFLEQSIPEL